ncbi:cell death activator CIDE-A-like [Megalops cyprinoides]|uniref:cell death activator CIDE-A-like n=1 Tax=Megalops cyprinoides TaxID=118141 RepID=UPI00186533C1|nr:cell death activator CIDE-A-like [Megalops cyprinoides]
MEYAKTLVPVSVMRKVSLVGTSIGQRVPPTASPRSFKVSTHNGFQKKGVMAASLDDLRDKTARAFLLTCQFLTIVLEEDGTTVDTEAFFQSLPDNTRLIVLERGQRWTRSQCVMGMGAKKPRRNGMAKLTFHLYKLHPKDFLGCLTIKAKLYEMYTVSYDIRCLGPKCMLMAFLRCLVYVASVAGHLLLCGSSYILQLIGEDGATHSDL